VTGLEHDEVGDTVKAGSADDLIRDSALLRMNARRIRDEVQRTRELLRERRHRQDPRLLRTPRPGVGDGDHPGEYVGADETPRPDGGPADDNAAAKDDGWRGLPGRDATDHGDLDDPGSDA
jgi:hypothetical protein